MRFFRRKKDTHYKAIEPDEILIDAANLPAYDTTRLEGKIERPLGERAVSSLLYFAIFLGLVFGARLFMLQVVDYDTLNARAEANRLNHSILIAERGRITDRNGALLAGNATGEEAGVSERVYPLGASAAHLIGYISYPKQDANGYWFQDATRGISGAEAWLDDALRGKNGLEIAESDASGRVVSGSVVRFSLPGEDTALSIDAELQKTLYDAIAARVRTSLWQGGAGAVMDIRTGELLALASYPSFDPVVLSEGQPLEVIDSFLSDSRSPFLDRSVSGLYTPGSVVKPFIAVAALEENIISPEKKILSTGSIALPNPYDPKRPSVFRDWKAHGWVDLRQAIAVSSDVYFYEVGGGYEDQRGLGIAKMEEYFKKFGFGAPSGIGIAGEEIGVVPNPEWKAANFDGERWLIGNTYHTAIGQYGFQATLLQLVRAVAAIANGGTLVTPSIVLGGDSSEKPVGVSNDALAIVGEGMRQAVTGGTAQAVNVFGLPVAAKTGTAEIGARKEFTNSVIIGFFPYEHPRYAFAVVMEKANAGTLEGAPSVMREVLEWIVAEKPEMAE